MRDRGRDSLVTFLERAARWRTLCYPASGAGRKGIHRPDLLAAQPAGPKTWRRFCIECKWPGKLPIYIDAAQVEALREQAELWGAVPVLMVRRKRDRAWRVVRPDALSLTRRGNFKLDEETYLAAGVLPEAPGRDIDEIVAPS